MKNIKNISNANDINAQISFLEQMIEESERKYDEVLYNMARTDITAFSEYINYEWFPARHHVYLLDKLKSALEGDTPNVIVTMPVGHGKSVYSSIVMPSFAAGHNPNERIIIAGHTQKFVENTIAKPVRNIIMGERFKKLFPATEIANDSRAADYFSFEQTGRTRPGFVLAKGVGGGVSGYRSTLTIADDLYPTQDDANSEAYRDKVKTWWYSDLSTRMLPGGRTFLVCTRWHGDDLLSHLMADSKSGKGDHFEVVELPAICEDPEKDPLGREYGEPLWGEYHTLEKLLSIKKKSPAVTWGALYQCNPIQDGGGIIDSGWYKYWKELPPEKDIKRKFVSFDLANTASERSDWSVGTAWVQTSDNRYFLTDIMRVRSQYDELVRQINDFARANQASAILVEDAGIGQVLNRTMAGQMYAPLLPIGTGTKSKEFRLDSVSPMIATGEVFFPFGHALLADLERELTEFPYSKHDDCVDSLSQALNWARGSAIRRGTKKIKGGF